MKQIKINELEFYEGKILINNYINKIIICLLLILQGIFTFLNIKYFPRKIIDKNEIRPYIKYINDCKNHKRYNRIKIINENPYISICIPALNMNKYIERTILSILNQSFQDYEIITVNDNSRDDTVNIIKRLQLEDNRIKLINHNTNKGVYYSRVESILFSKGKFIILMDPDDLYLNENLFKELYNYNIKYNLDIIEFTVFQQIEGRRNIFYPKNHYESHYHNFSHNFIFQPNLSEILFHNPNNNMYSYSICRNIWNKMIRRKIFLDMHQFIGLDYFNDFVITADDMAMNIISYHFANNYSNIYLPGYMYNIRPISMSRGNGGSLLAQVRAINYLLYFKVLYKYVKQFEINRRILFYELRNLKRYIYSIKDNNMTFYENQFINFSNEILNDEFSDKIFKSFVVELLLYFENVGNMKNK
jgi:glycosyltransferase involved in cell wall biosynthesis